MSDTAILQPVSAGDWIADPERFVLPDASAARLNPLDRTQIRQALQRFLRGLNINYPETFVVGADFFTACCQLAQEYGFPLSGSFDLRPFIFPGATMACTSYRQQPQQKSQIFVALYTAAFIQLDVLGSRMDGYSQFAARMMQAQPQANKTLDALVRLLQDISRSSGPVISEVTLVSSFNYFASITLEEMSKTMTVRPQAESYASYKRYLDGLGDFYAYMVFPPSVPLDTFVQAIPDISKISCLLNDVLSFYKEQAAGETDNLVVNTANAAGITHIAALDRITDECVDVNDRIFTIIGNNDAARRAYEVWLYGFVQFHTSLPRYRLDELEMRVGEPFADGLATPGLGCTY